MNDKAFIAPCALVCFQQNCKVPENICDYPTNVVKLSHFIFALLHFSFPAIFPNSTHSERGCQWCSVHSPSSSATTLALEQSKYGHWLKIVLLFRRNCLAFKVQIHQILRISTKIIPFRYFFVTQNLCPFCTEKPGDAIPRGSLLSVKLCYDLWYTLYLPVLHAG